MKQPLRISYDRAVLIALFVFGAGMFAATFAIDSSTASQSDVGPAFVPRVFSAGLAVCAALALLFSKPSPATARTDRVVFLAMALLVAYALALPVLGYAVSTVATLSIMLMLVRAGSWWAIAAFSLGMTLAMYLVFERLLTVGLPVGPWGF